MDIESLRLALNEPSLFGIGLGFVTGFIFSFNPVAIAAIPVALAEIGELLFDAVMSVGRAP